MIQFENISKSFGSLKVLENISVTFEKGQSVAIIGPNGSGKTTLIRTLLRMVIPDRGRICVNGLDTSLGVDYRSLIGYMPQIGRYPPNLRISQLFEMMTDIRSKDGKEMKPDEELIDLYQLKKIYHKPLGTLSGGTVQKVSAALTFLFNPDILILDEPTAGLDPFSSEILKEKISRSGKLLIITSHVLSDLDELATSILYLQDGRIAFFDKIQTLKEEVGETALNKAIVRLMGKNNTLK